MTSTCEVPASNLALRLRAGTLDFLLDSLLEAGIHDVVLVTHYLHEQVERYAAFRSLSHDQRVLCVYQSHLFGTAHALQAVIEAAPEIVEAPFLLSATDYLVPREFFGQLLQFHAAHAGESSVSMKELDPAEMASRSSVRFNDDQSIAEIVEKPVAGTAPSAIGANLTLYCRRKLCLTYKMSPCLRVASRKCSTPSMHGSVMAVWPLVWYSRFHRSGSRRETSCGQASVGQRFG